MLTVLNGHWAEKRPRLGSRLFVFRYISLRYRCTPGGIWWAQTAVEGREAALLSLDTSPVLTAPVTDIELNNSFYVKYPRIRDAPSPPGDLALLFSSLSPKSLCECPELALLSRTRPIRQFHHVLRYLQPIKLQIYKITNSFNPLQTLLQTIKLLQELCPVPALLSIKTTNLQTTPITLLP